MACAREFDLAMLGTRVMGRLHLINVGRSTFDDSIQQGDSSGAVKQALDALIGWETNETSKGRAVPSA